MATYQCPERTNCYRVCRLLLEGGKELMIQFLRQSIGYLTLDTFLATNWSLVNVLRGRNIIHQSQMDILYPPSGCGTDTHKWDITLTACIMREFVHPITSLQKTAINDIRDLRNRLYGHIGEFKIRENEFNSSWSQIQQILHDGASILLNDPSSFKLQSLIDDIQREAVTNVDTLKEIIQSWKESDIAVLGAVQGLDDKVENLFAEQDEKLTDMTSMLQRIERNTKSQSTGPTSFLQRVTRNLGRLAGIAWTLIAYYFTLLLGYRPVEQQECTTSESDAEDEATLPEKFRVLKSGLMDYYKSLLTLPTGVGSLSDQVDIDDIYVEPCLVLVDHAAGTEEQAKENEKYIPLEDLFLVNTSECRQIYVSADAGNGKTSLCKRIIKDWCSFHSQGQLSGVPGRISTLKHFHFLFYISLRNVDKQYDINEMIVSQHKQADEFLDEVLEQYSERCLIVLDGLDEWTAPRKSGYPSVSNGVPGRNPHLAYTMLTTTRPWKLENLRLSSTEIDRQVEVRGVKSVDEFGRKLVNAHNQMENKHKLYNDFEYQLRRTGLQKMKETPILLKQLICLWHNDRQFGISKTIVYTNMVEMLFMLAEKRQDVSQLSMRRYECEMGSVATPKCFENVGRCERYKSLLLSIGKLAFETMFCEDKETQLVFNYSEAKESGLHERDIELCLAVGILTQSIIPDKTCERKSLSFLHKTFHEYFTALFLSQFGNSLSDLKTRISSPCMSLDSLFDMEDMFLFLSGMCPSLMDDVSTCLVTAINNDRNVENMRRQVCDDYINYHFPTILRSLIVACCRESSDNGQGPLYLPVTDLYIESISQEDVRTLILCMEKDPSVLISCTCKQNTVSAEDMSSLMASISNAYSLRYIRLTSVKCSDHASGEGCRYVIDLSEHSKLRELHLEDISPGSMTLSPCISPSIWWVTLRNIYTLSHDDMCSLMSIISNAFSLEFICLDSVKCRDHAIGEGCQYVIDLSGLSGLEELHVEDMSPESITLSRSISTSIRRITMINIHTLSHDGMRSLISSIPNAHSLKYIKLDSVKCRDYASGEGCGYLLDLSRFPRLGELFLQDISPGSMTLSPPINQSIYMITMRNIHTLPHDDMCSLMSNISNIHSLRRITLYAVKCRDHASDERCGYLLDLSGLSSLEELHVQNISPGSMTLSPPIRYISIKHIHTLSHDGICSLMSSISNTHSLRNITLNSVKCRERASGDGCLYAIDLSGLNGLEVLIVQDMSPGSITLSTSIRTITMRNIHTLSHDGMCSLMSSISNAHSLTNITMNSVKCREHAIPEGCGFAIDFTGLRVLKVLDVQDISPGSMTLSPCISPSIRTFTMRNIHTLSHGGICSMMSSLSNAHSLEDINLTSVKCSDHASGEGCRYVIDLSRHSSLDVLKVRDISPGSMTLSPSISLSIMCITMRNIHTLSHDSMCSLMSSVPLEKRKDWKSIRCIDYASGNRCGNVIE